MKHFFNRKFMIIHWNWKDLKSQMVQVDNLNICQGPYLPDGIPCTVVCLQVVQNGTSLLEDHIHLVPYLPLSFCGLCVWTRHNSLD